MENKLKRQKRKLIWTVVVLLLFMGFLVFILIEQRKSYKATTGRLTDSLQDEIELAKDWRDCDSVSEVLITSLEQSRDSLSNYVRWYNDCVKDYSDYQSDIYADEERRGKAWLKYKNKKAKEKADDEGQQARKLKAAKDELNDEALKVLKLNDKLSKQTKVSDSLQGLFEPIAKTTTIQPIEDDEYTPSDEELKKRKLTKYGRSKKKKTYTNYGKPQKP